MVLSIKNDTADRLARELAATTGESITDAVTTAIEERLRRERRARTGLAVRLRRLSQEAAALPLLDDRPEDDLLGYDDLGVPS
jgi:antitoxin VapB